ncbi:hypothetical protein [Spiroplasma melliferum]|uniref:Uncharacterized protein n=2 Tax=Spiroplasma melliferum TaxID=2134 RepID=A0AAI9T4K9_SPIME|nr:hypothetical protein [Spiroplasma melliferum]KAI92925.1 hypothetical protein SPM_002705 [Spiroplasma melliferum KC3]QCO23298.1 hypothetical protein SRED_001761 [Spiroplasma melliferum]
MKKLFIIFSVVGLFITGITSKITSCRMIKYRDANYSNSNLQNDMLIWMKIASDISNEITNYDNNGNIKNSNEFPELNQFYNLVNQHNQSLVLDRSNAQINLGLRKFQNEFKEIFQKLNVKISETYQNYFNTLEKKPLYHLEEEDKFTLTYVDLDKINKLTNTATTGVRAVQIQYEFMLDLSFKSLRQMRPFTVTYVVTNEPNEIKKILEKSIEKIKKYLINFFNNYEDVIVDQNNEFKSIYDDFEINYNNNVKPLDKIFIKQFNEKIKKNNAINQEIREAIAFDKTGNKYLMRLILGTVTAENSGQLPETADIGNYQPALWAGEGITPPGLTAENFVTAYKKSLPIFNVNDDHMILARLSVNLNFISLYGLPLAGTLKIDGKNFESNILISRQGLDNKLMNFGKIIVAFHKYYQVEIKKRVSTFKDEINFKHTSVFHVGEELFKKFKNNISSANAIFKELLNNFKQSSIAHNLPDLKLFNLYNLVKDKAVWIGNNNYEVIQNRIVFNYYRGSFCLAFTFGLNRTNSIFYAAYGSNGGDIDVKYGWWAWILIDK